MPVIINGQTYYRTAEVFRMVGISRNTLFRWLKEGIIKAAEYRDRRGWRLFTEDDTVVLKAEASRVSKTNPFRTTTGSTKAVTSAEVRNEKR